MEEIEVTDKPFMATITPMFSGIPDGTTLTKKIDATYLDRSVGNLVYHITEPFADEFNPAYEDAQASIAEKVYEKMELAKNDPNTIVVAAHYDSQGRQHSIDLEQSVREYQHLFTQQEVADPKGTNNYQQFTVTLGQTMIGGYKVTSLETMVRSYAPQHS